MISSAESSLRADRRAGGPETGADTGADTGTTFPFRKTAIDCNATSTCLVFSK